MNESDAGVTLRPADTRGAPARTSQKRSAALQTLLRGGFAARTMLLTRPDAGVADEIDGSLPVTDAPAIDQAEALLFLVEGLLRQLDDTSRADVRA